MNTPVVDLNEAEFNKLWSTNVDPQDEISRSNITDLGLNLNDQAQQFSFEDLLKLMDSPVNGLNTPQNDLNTNDDAFVVNKDDPLANIASVPPKNIMQSDSEEEPEVKDEDMETGEGQKIFLKSEDGQIIALDTKYVLQVKDEASEKVEENENADEEEIEKEESEEEYRPPVSKKRKMTKRSSKAVEAPKPTSRKAKAKKLYEARPFSDPEMEKNRRNALNAKINRDRKKKEREALVQQMDELRKTNTKLLSENKKLRSVLAAHGIKI